MLRKLAIVFLKFYKVFISPLLGSNCRFYPPCSTYTYQAIERHGFLKGMVLGFKRILKCNPFHPGGVDEVPE